MTLRSERLYYDGVRRIQEVYIDPSLSMSMALQGEGGSELEAAAEAIEANSEEELDGAATPAALEQMQVSNEYTNGGGTVYLSREYVWGPGDWGIDEIVAQYDEARRVTFPLQDASGDVIALADLGGASNSARVVTEIVYDAYGRVLAREDRSGTTPPDLRLGHKGLFFDRLDLGVADPGTYADTRRLEAGSRIIGFVRNRTLHTDWGCWNQRDPNATGMVVQRRLSKFGHLIMPSVQPADLMIHLGDGANVTQYLYGSTLVLIRPLFI